MGTIFTLGQDTKDIIATVLDDIITELGKTVRLIFPGKEEACPACNGATVGQSTGGVFGRGGGQLSIPNMACPSCFGKGFRRSEPTRDLVMKCEWDPKHFVRPFKTVDVRLPFATLETKFYLTDLADVLAADRLLAQLPMEPYLHQPFKLDSEPGDPSSLVQGRFCVAYWARIGG